MLINVEDIRKIRKIAGNISDDRIEICISEAEKLDLIPFIGAAFYQKLNSLGEIEIDEDGTKLMDETDVIATGYEGDLPINEWKFLNGGYYTTLCGEYKWFGGIRLALCYFAYARFIRSHVSQVTPFGVVTKIGDDSTPVSYSAVSAMSAEAKKIGDEYLRQSLDFWNETRKAQDKKTGSAKKTKRFVSIGD